ncbi:hypothetical protein C475_20263 [Halosimplex carlsbadense 2-9-1]|uniref:Uncharacterized protein n=1 Tax=Halosimplex carlsbadense 2-9-1 TaxID=797114 RepID=M0CFH4_9EURY|nr:hypothetical protein [Halosimplex carlsbadense]ELZ20634.1 hypothetical protein C475_20263 [Halosimplex carlsbadense 2-9-1]
MRRSSGREAQTEPLAAVVAVVVVALALALYVGAFEANLPGPLDRDHAETAADRIERALTAGGVARPGRLSAALDRGPDGYRVNVTLTVGNRIERAGPAPPETADTARRRVSVRTDPGRVEPGRLEVRVWT